MESEVLLFSTYDIQYNDSKEKDQWKSSNLQNTTKDLVLKTHLKPE